MKRLDALTLPLNGTVLIEASAGTGKTYTITTLFIRLLLEKKLAVDQILVVTFTIAATEELRLKIASRLQTALALLQGDEADDPILRELLSGFDQAEALLALKDVAARLDEVAVFTIDAMCLRILNEFALDCDTPLQMEFVANDESIRKQAAQDYWRKVVGSKDHLATDEVLALTGPENLLNTITPLLNTHESIVKPILQRADVEDFRRRLNKRFYRVMSLWETESGDIETLLRGSAGVSINARTYNEKALDNLFAELHTLVLLEKLPEELPEKFFLLTRTHLESKKNKDKVPPSHVFFEHCEALNQEFQSYRLQRQAVVLQEAGAFIANRIDTYKRDHGLLHFEDLRVRLYTALKGAAAEKLGDDIRGLWPCALVDEAQDTDPMQNHIFQQIYRGQEACGLFYIGDPKQAIYGFRGADVFTYMQAARNFKHQRTLEVNWRSSSPMVKAVNTLFSQSVNPFVFGSDIEFRHVSAAGVADKTPLRFDGNALAAMQFRTLRESSSASASVTESVALHCAGEIATMIAAGRDGRLMIGERPLIASDIAVLVKSHREGAHIQNALRAVGVKSAANGGRTVFDSAEAQQLLVILHAISQPGVNAVRRAVVTEVIGEPASRIEQRNDAEDGWDDLINRFHEYRTIWLDRSLMAALQTLLNDMAVAERALSSMAGERRLTNLAQLMELLQIQSRLVPSVEQLIAWFEWQLEQKTLDDELVQRLESDEDLVQIVTIHKSKGLEYPVVYLPFGWTVGRTGKSGSGRVVRFHDRETFRTTLDLGSAEMTTHQGLAAEEDFSEQLRLLYVALTRAQHHCVIGWDDAGGKRSALAYLLHQTDGQINAADFSLPKDTDLTDTIALLGRDNPDALSCRPWAPVSTSLHQKLETASLDRRLFRGSIDKGWRITSYTGLQSGEDSGVPDYDFSTGADNAADIDSENDLGAIARLPAGARTGQILHEVFELADFTDAVHIKAVCQEVGSRYGLPGDEDNWSAVIAEIVGNTVNTVIDPQLGLRLCDVPVGNRINEMEFFFALGGMSASSIAAVLSEDDRYAGIADGLRFTNIKGLMRGFIDLVGRKDNRYFIVDYKSNLLGQSRMHYQQQALGESMRAHRYDLQYLIYLVALHRFLKARLGQQYDYERDVAGAYYLFLRGIKPGSDSGIWHDKPSLTLIEKLDACFNGEGVT